MHRHFFAYPTQHSFHLKHKDVPVIPFEGGKFEVYAGEVNGVTSPIKLFTPFLFTAVTLENGSNEMTIPAGYNTYLYVLEGEVEVQNKKVNAFDVIHFEIAPQAETILFSASSNAKFVVFSGEPIKAPVIARGPFVMNTQEEIAEAYASYRNGTFLDGKPY